MLITVLLLVAVLVMGCAQLRHIRRVRQERSRIFDPVINVVDDAVVRPDGLAFPVLTGSWHGHPIRLEPIVDALTLRKLPVLWLVVELRRNLDVAAPLDILLRPTGTEFFSPNGRYSRECSSAEWMPAHARVVSPAPRDAPSLSILEPFGSFLADDRTKELCMTEHGLRAVWRLGEGQQAQYRTTRRADFGSVRVRREELDTVLRTLGEIGDVLAPQPARSHQ